MSEMQCRLGSTSEEWPQWEHCFLFLGGFFCGLLAVSLYFKCAKNFFYSAKSGFGLSLSESIKILESSALIRQNLSSTDNAKLALASMARGNLSKSSKACVVYALDVLQSEANERSIPVGLKEVELEISDMASSKSGDCPEIVPTKQSKLPKHSDATIRQWLLSNFTPITPKKYARRKTFRNVAMGIRFTIRLRKAISAPKVLDTAFVFDVEPLELETILKHLEGVDDWNWSVWTLFEITQERPLQVLGWHLLNSWNLIETLRLDRNVLREWLAFVEDMYEDNPYHNSTHAADVLHAVHYFLLHGAAETFSQLTIFALFVTAMVHDVGHDGFSNIYHQNALTDRALLFNDQSIQENYHSMSVFRSMYTDPRINILSVLTNEKAREVRRLIVMMTLGTDMKHHFSNLQDFKGLLKSIGPKLDQWTSQAAHDKFCVTLLHAADLSNPGRSFDLAKKWAGLVLEEFFNQGDIEKEAGLPISPLCSRDSTLMPASQVYFIVYIVEPTYQALCELLPQLQGTVLAQVRSNLAAWRALDTAAASNDAPTLEDLDKSSRTHSRRGSRTWSRMDSTSSSSQGPSPILLFPRGRSITEAWKAGRWSHSPLDGAMEPPSPSSAARILRARRSRKSSAPDIFFISGRPETVGEAPDEREGHAGAGDAAGPCPGAGTDEREGGAEAGAGAGEGGGAPAGAAAGPARKRPPVLAMRSKSERTLLPRAVPEEAPCRSRSDRGLAEPGPPALTWGDPAPDSAPEASPEAP